MRITTKGDWKDTERFLKKCSKNDPVKILNKYGRRGVAALKTATPVDTGKTAESWDYIVEKKGDKWTLTWTNSNIVGGIPVVILLQYGHGTRNGGYVRGIDFINPSLIQIFKSIAEEAWREVTSA